MQCVVERQRFYADPDLTVHFDIGPGSGPGYYPKIYTCWKIRKVGIDFYSQQCQFTLSYLSCERQRCSNFQY
jgi:hypothetical protein